MIIMYLVYILGGCTVFVIGFMLGWLHNNRTNYTGTIVVTKTDEDKTLYSLEVDDVAKLETLNKVIFKVERS